VETNLSAEETNLPPGSRKARIWFTQAIDYQCTDKFLKVVARWQLC